MRLPGHVCPLTPEDERGLVRRMRAGDEAAFDVFAASYVPALHRFAGRRLWQDRELTREIVQATLCRALARLDTYRGESALFTWLCACCINEIAGHFRALARRPVTVGLPGPPDEDVWTSEPPDPGAPTPEEALQRLETAERVHLALDRLPRAYARVVEWRYLEEVEVGEIARRLKSTYKAAESLLSRARRAFRETFDQLANVPVAAEKRRAVSGRGLRG